MECGLGLWQHDNIDKLMVIAKISMPCQVKAQAQEKKMFL